MTPAIEPHCRIGKIKLHNGASVHVIDQQSMRQPESESIRQDIVDRARRFHDEWPDLAGFAIVGWTSQGYWGTAMRVSVGSPYPTVAVPVLASECLREDETVNAAVSWINKQNRGEGPK